jgi:hypothetical protein
MSVSTMLATLGPLVAMALAVQMGSGFAGEASREGVKSTPIQAAPTRTGKERLGGKPSDEQRVDNCNVPPDLRGPKPRPDHCGDEVSTRPPR